MALKHIEGAWKLGRLLLCLGLLTPALPAATVSVNAVGLSFNSNNVTIDIGDTVHWTNLGTGHNVTQSANAGANAYDGSGFYSGATCCSGPSTFDFTFNVAGDYYYICEAHAGSGMKGQVHVRPPSPTPTACATASPTVTATATLTATPVPGSPTDTPTISPSFSASPSFSDSPTPSATPSVSPTFTPSPSVSHSPTVSPVPTGYAFAGVEDARLLASPITGGRLRLWANLTGQAAAAEVALYSAASNVIAVLPLSPVTGGAQRWTLALPAMAAQPVWIQLRVQEDGRWRKGPVIRSYVLP